MFQGTQRIEGVFILRYILGYIISACQKKSLFIKNFIWIWVY